MRFEKSNPLVYGRIHKGEEIQQINNFDRFVKMIDAVAVSYCKDFVDHSKVMNLKTGHRSIAIEKALDFYNDQQFFDHQEYYKTASGEIIYVSHPYVDINFLLKEKSVKLNNFLDFMDSLNYTVSFLSPEFDWYNPNFTMAIIIRRKKEREQK